MQHVQEFLSAQHALESHRTAQRSLVDKLNMATDTEYSRKEYLTKDLPQELLDQVIGYLDLSSQLRLRLVFDRKTYEARVIPVLRPTLSTLYVAPSKLSICYFRRICESTFFQQHI